MDTPNEQQRKTPGLMAPVHEFVRWLFYVVLATGCIAALVFYFVHTRLDGEIRRHIEAKFQSHYDGLKVTIRSARRIPGAGIEIRGLLIRDPQQSAPRDVMAYVDELLVRCDAGLGQLVQGEICTQQIIARRLRLHAHQAEDGSWNTHRLFPPPKFGDRTPPLIFESAMIEVVPREASGCPPIVLSDVNVTVLPEHPQVGDSSVPPSTAPDVRRIVGNLHSSLFDAANLDGRLDLATAGWSVTTEVQGLKVSSKLMALLPEQFVSGPQPALEGQASVRCHLQGSFNNLATCQFTASGSYHGSIEDPRLPQPFTHAHVSFRCNNNVVQIDEATAVAAGTTVSVAGKFARDGRLELRASAEDLYLDRQFFESVPEKWQSVWDKFEPTGYVNAQLALSSDGQTWNHDLTVDGSDVAFSYYRFPYRLEDGRGRLRLKDGILELTNVRAKANNREVQIEGRLEHLGENCLGWVKFSLQDPIPIDDRVISAIPPENRAFIEKLAPQGMVTVSGRFERQAGAPPSEHKQLTLNFSDCSINYEHFPYPLHRIRGTLSMTDGRWVFRDLEGYNDSGWVMCHGTWEPHQGGGTLLSLDFNAMDVPLEDELRHALKPEMQDMWNRLQPRGSIDHLKIGLRYASWTRDLSMEVVAIKRPPSQNVEGRSITVKPSWLPYRWDNVTGIVRFHNGVAELTNIQAEHGRTKAQFSGLMEIAPGGPWRAHIEPLTVDHVDTSSELTSALPPQVGSALANLDIRGLVSVSGSLDLAGSRTPSALPTASWNVAFDLENGALDCGVPVEHIHGGLTLIGASDGQRLASRGELSVDSLTYKGIQLTRMQGPIFFQDSQLWMGEWIPQDGTAGPPKPVSADLWGGNVAGNGHITLKGESEFELEGTLVDADVAAISREATPSRHPITGRTFAHVIVNGSGRGTHTLRGRGRVVLKDADLYELPVMMRLLKILTLNRPDRNAFDSSEVDFRIEADRIYLDRIDFDGDAISLDGRGEMNLQRQINLTFGSAIGRDDIYRSLLRPVLKEAGRRLVLLHVTGTLDQPHVRREFVPELNQTIQQLFPNQAREQRREASRDSTSRRIFPGLGPR